MEIVNHTGVKPLDRRLPLVVETDRGDIQFDNVPIRFQIGKDQLGRDSGITPQLVGTVYLRADETTGVHNIYTPVDIFGMGQIYRFRFLFGMPDGEVLWINRGGSLTMHGVKS
jgi:hypothetical protein